MTLTRWLPRRQAVRLRAASYAGSLVDRVPAGQVGVSGIIPDANALASISSTVVGIAADGAAEIVLRIPTPTAGTQIQLSLTEEDGSAAGADGYLTTLLPSDPASSTLGGNPITVTSVPLSSGEAMAFAVYYTPKDFVRDGNSSDSSMATRDEFVDVSSGGSVQTQQEIEIVRPPVTFIHGLWGNAGDGSQIMAYLASRGPDLTPSFLNYDGSVVILSSNPNYGMNVIASGGRTRVRIRCCRCSAQP